MIYTLTHFDTPLIEFSAENKAEAGVKIIKIHDENRELFPLDLAEVSADAVESWIKHRSIPKNRAYVDTLLSTMGLSINRPFDIIRVSSGLSLNDCYWLKSESNNNDFDRVNAGAGKKAKFFYTKAEHKVHPTPATSPIRNFMLIK